MEVGERSFHVDDLDALIAWNVGERVGAATCLTGSAGDCELVSIDALTPRAGVGTALLAAVEERARGAGCARVTLSTTNDRLDALRFYQRRGYRITGVRAGAVDEARRRKPTLPLVGEHGIPLHDELRLAKELGGA
jgi:GNAT superfamily N-acetyltransferase